MRLIFTFEATLITRIVGFGTRKTQKCLLKSLYLQRLTVWCSIWAGGIIEPYLFENEAGAAASVNELCYRTMIN